MQLQHSGQQQQRRDLQFPLRKIQRKSPAVLLSSPPSPRRPSVWTHRFTATALLEQLPGSLSQLVSSVAPPRANRYWFGIRHYWWLVSGVPCSPNWLTGPINPSLIFFFSYYHYSSQIFHKWGNLPDHWRGEQWGWEKKDLMGQKSSVSEFRRRRLSRDEQQQQQTGSWTLLSAYWSNRLGHWMRQTQSELRRSPSAGYRRLPLTRSVRKPATPTSRLWVLLPSDCCLLASLNLKGKVPEN